MTEENTNLVKQAAALRRYIKQDKWSNNRIARMFNDLIIHGYRMGYKTAIEDFRTKVQEAKNANQEFNSSNNVDGVQLQSNGSKRQGSDGADADSTIHMGGHSFAVSAADVNGLDGPDAQHLDQFVAPGSTIGAGE